MPEPPPVGYRRLPLFRHLLVLGLLLGLSAAMYGPVLNAGFQFDDVPNILEPPAVRMDTLSAEALARAVTEVPARNRIVVSASFALQHWAAQYLPRLVDDAPPEPDILVWQFRIVNYAIHVLAGYGVVLLFLRLLRMPAVRGRFDEHLFPVALVAGLVWFACPVHTQAVTYIVQRATALSTCFYVWGLVAYCEARAAERPTRRGAFLALAALAMLFAVFSKEFAATFPLAVLAIEWLLIARPGRRTRRDAGAMFALSACVLALAVLWMYGYSGRNVEPETAPAPVVRPAATPDPDGRDPAVRTPDAPGLAARVAADLWNKVMSDRPDRKNRISPRQRLLTEARVLAMYQSLLLFPAPGRLNLDYDFLETRRLWDPLEADSLPELMPLLLVLGVFLLVFLAPPRWRGAVLLSLLVLMGAGEWLASRYAVANPVRLSAVWREPWPVPAILWHALLLGFAALYSRRRPLLAFGLVFFYTGHLVESGILMLETVFEHRLYLPSVGFYLALVVFVHDILLPPRETELGPPPFGSRHPKEAAA